MKMTQLTQMTVHMFQLGYFQFSKKKTGGEDERQVRPEPTEKATGLFIGILRISCPTLPLSFISFQLMFLVHFL